MARIGIGGFQHETNTFAPHLATLTAFREVAAFPRLPLGDAVVTEVEGLNIPIAGFIEAARSRGHQLLPTAWAMAVPSSYVTDEAFEHITGKIVDGLRKQLPLDAVYLCLHGAMVTESHQDGEGELLRRVRALVGPDVPVVASLDLHCNTTEAMIDCTDALVAYRTYPHVDMAETGARAFVLLDRMLQTGKRPAKAFRKADFLISLVWQCSFIEPAQSIYASFDAIEREGIESISFTPGFPPADIHDCGPAVFAYAPTQALADSAADGVMAAVVEARDDWNGILYSPDEATRKALSEYQGRPFILADTQDNPGAGGVGDTVGLLEGLVRNHATDTVFGLLYDPEAALAAHGVGIGRELTIGVGAGSGQKGHLPFEATFTVEALSDGEFIGTGPMSRGARFHMGPTAELRVNDVSVVVTSAMAQTKDQSMLRHIGIDLERQRIIALKSSVHFRADFEPMAESVLVVEAPGPNIADHLRMDYRNLRRGLLLTPNGPAFEP
jgi:microcystin degradation protein MlrC